MKSDLSRFLVAQNQVYLRALSEIKAGRQTTHWMWYIFPQIKGLGKSDTSVYYSLASLDQATEYLRHPVLGKNLIEISFALLELPGLSILDILGAMDVIKLRSCMTLFSRVENTDPVFESVLTKYFGGKPDELTLQLLSPFREL